MRPNFAVTVAAGLFAAFTAVFIALLVIDGGPGNRIVAVLAATAAAVEAGVLRWCWSEGWPKP